MTWYRPDGRATQQIRADVAQFGSVDVGARFQVSAAAINQFTNSGRLFYHLDEGSGMLLGDWYTASATYMQLMPTYMGFCGPSVGCPLIFYGNGNINSGGSINLVSGGDITSANNFTLGNVEGLQFQSWTGSTYEAPRTIQFFKNGVLTGGMGQDAAGSILLHSRTWGPFTGARIAVGTSEHLVNGLRPGLFITHEPVAGYHGTNFVIQGISGAGNATAVQIVPLHGVNSPATLSLLGNNYGGQWWHQIWGSTYYSNGTGGFSGVTYDYNNGVARCQMNWSGGIMVSTNCQ